MILFLEPFYRRLHHCFPFVPLLTANEVPSRVTVMIGGASVFKIVVVISNEMCVNAF